MYQPDSFWREKIIEQRCEVLSPGILLGLEKATESSSEHGTANGLETVERDALAESRL